MDSSAVDTGFQGDPPREARQGFFEPLVELSVIVIPGLIKIGHSTVLNKAPRTATLIAMLRIPDAKRETA